jgi:hypothetical protein
MGLLKINHLFEVSHKDTKATKYYRVENSFVLFVSLWDTNRPVPALAAVLPAQ